MPGFIQSPPQLTNTFAADRVLQETLERLLPAPLHGALWPAWNALGARAAGPLAELARQAQAELPRHVPYDAWGNRIDAIEVSPAWQELHREAARQGLCAVAYERELGAFARLHQFALLHLYGPSSAIYTCYLAMTDGAARTLLELDAPEPARSAVARLTSRDPDQLWTSGQWMTERSGGSDVGGTETLARPEPDGTFRLWGDKWFTSAITSEMTLLLARLEGAPAGSHGLSLFYLEQRLADGSRNGIRIHRLKDKLGTRALPTAELCLEGARATLIGAPGRGVKSITTLLNLTRLHNAISACGMMARLLQLLRDYAQRRRAFGALLAEKPLHRETLAALHVEYAAAVALTYECVRLRGRQEAGEASEQERACLRLLTPLAKLQTAKQAVAVASEALEGFGGAGYVEDTGLPVWLRDAQVLPIWEGTTNVLSLDTLRAVRDGALSAWLAEWQSRAQALAATPLAPEAALLHRHLGAVAAVVPRLAEAGPAFVEASARSLALVLAALSSALPLCEQAAWALAHGRGEHSLLAARRFVAARIPVLPDPARASELLHEAELLSGVTAV